MGPRHGREYYLDIECKKKTKDDIHGSEDCFDVPGHFPIMQSTVNGVKVCGRRAMEQTL